jgi:hypothetical protein
MLGDYRFKVFVSVLCRTVTAPQSVARLLPPGVHIVIHGQVFPADHAMKDRDLGTFVAKS